MAKSILVLCVLSLGLAIIFINCKTEFERETNSPASESTNRYNEGFAIVSQNCVSCHSPDKSLTNRIAPPLVAVKEHYFDDGMEESEFVQQMSAFLSSPNVMHSKMPKAIEKFGLMPALAYSKEQFESAASYIYRAEFEKPDWFEKHYKQEQENLFKYTEENEKNYLKKGLNTVILAQAILGNNLKTAIQIKGTHGAVEFCNEKASILTDSLTAALKINIKRVSDKNRNPANSANTKELAYINKVKLALEEKAVASPEIFEENNKMLGYYPILTNPMCIKCHGDPGTEMDERTSLIINKLYPEDKATGYTVNELRGIWVIEMEK